MTREEKSAAMWLGYWTMRVEIEDCLVIWLKGIARGATDTYWEHHIEERVDAAMVFHTEYRRLNRIPKRRRKAA